MTFTEQYPPFVYSHRDYSSEQFDDDEARRAFPKTSPGPCVYPMSQSTTQSLLWPGTPKKLAEYVKRDLPLLGLHVTTCANATLIELTWPHTAMDGAGQRELLAAWSMALAGRDSEIPPMLGAREDVAWALASDERDEPLPPDVLTSSELTGFGRLVFFVRLLWRLVTAPRSDVKMLYLPRAVVSRWREEAAPPAHDTATDAPTPSFVSDGDLIAAWLVSLAAAERRRPARRYLIAGAIDCRGRIPALRDAAGVFVQNLLCLYWAAIPGEAAAGRSTSSLGDAALAHRRAVAAQATESQMVHHLRRHRAAAPGDPQMRIPGQARDVVLSYNNLSGLRIAAAADFGPAVVPNKDGTRVGSGRVVVHFFVLSRSTITPEFICVDRDEGGYWIWATASKLVWEKIAEEIGATDGNAHAKGQETMSV